MVWGACVGLRFVLHLNCLFVCLYSIVFWFDLWCVLDWDLLVGLYVFNCLVTVCLWCVNWFTCFCVVLLWCFVDFGFEGFACLFDIGTDTFVVYWFATRISEFCLCFCGILVGCICSLWLLGGLVILLELGYLLFMICGWCWFEIVLGLFWLRFSVSFYLAVLMTLFVLLFVVCFYC